MLKLLVAEDVDEWVDSTVGKHKPFAGEPKIWMGVNGQFQVDEQPKDLLVKIMDTVVSADYNYIPSQNVKDYTI